MHFFEIEKLLFLANLSRQQFLFSTFWFLEHYRKLFHPQISSTIYKKKNKKKRKVKKLVEGRFALRRRLTESAPDIIINTIIDWKSRSISLNTTALRSLLLPRRRDHHLHLQHSLRNSKIIEFISSPFS